MRRLSLFAFVALGLLVAVTLAFAVSPYASSSPDGLERVAGDKGFLDAGRLASVQEDAPIPDYAVPGIAEERLATSVAGLIGTLGVFAVGLGLAYVLRRRASARSTA